jgi:DUF1680 family protein
MQTVDGVRTIRVNCGGPAVDGLSADQPYSPGGWGYDKGLAWSVRASAFADPEKGIENDFGFPNAFATFRYHAGAPLHYRFDLPDGYYELRLYFAEPWRGAPGGRVFDVRVNGRTVLPRFDVVAEAGGGRRGVERVLSRVPVTGGQLDVEFATVEHDPFVSVIVVTREGEDVPPPAAPPPAYPASDPGLRRTSDDDRAIGYHGAWTVPTGLAGRGSHRSNVQGSAVDFTFRGSRIRWIGSRGSDHGLAEVFVDGKLQQVVDTYTPELRAGQVLFEKAGLSTDRYHTVRIRVTRGRNPAAVDCYQDVEAFESEQPVDVDAELARVAYEEYATIKSGDRPYPDPATWRRVAYRASAPERGVTLGPGLFRTSLERNIAYLKTCFGFDRWVSPDGPQWWIRSLPASNEGRILAGAGHALRWVEDADLRGIVTAIVSVIEARQREDGYVLPFAEADLGGVPSEADERRNYDRTMFTKGLIAAAISGDDRAARVLRRFYDWFDGCEYTNAMLEGSLGCQGHVASTLVGLAPFGKTEDLVVGERFYVQHWLLDELAREEPLSIYKYPLNRPHCYFVTVIEAYLDHYRANGNPRYLAAARGAWACYRDNFVHVGGAAAISEWGYGTYPPKSYLLGRGNGELCGSVFWVDLNHRLLQLAPEDEAYAAEIERSIYNVALANQAETGAIRYHARLHGRKEPGRLESSCCEVMGTGLYGRLPQYVYSIASDGLYVNLYEPSELTWRHGDQDLTVRLTGAFPFRPDVSLAVSTTRPQALKVRLRVPGWAAAAMPIAVNGEVSAEGRPGEYVTLDRVWRDGDRVAFRLPFGFRLTRYEGFDQVNGYDRYALEYGPILMALVGPLDERFTQPDGQPCARLRVAPEGLPEALEPVPDRPLHFAVRGHPEHSYRPYWEVSTETFTCFPVVST